MSGGMREETSSQTARQRDRSDSLSVLVDTANERQRVQDMRHHQGVLQTYLKGSRSKIQQISADSRNVLLQSYLYPAQQMMGFKPCGVQSSISNIQSSTRKRGRKRKRAIPPPKKAMSAYNAFFKETRLKLLKEYDNKITFEMLGKEVGKRWHKLTAKEKIPFQKRSSEDKERFKREMEEYKKKLALTEKQFEQNKLRMLQTNQHHMYPMNLLQRNAAYAPLPPPSMSLAYPHFATAGGGSRFYPNTSYLASQPSHRNLIQRLANNMKIPMNVTQNNVTNMIEVMNPLDSNIHGKMFTSSRPQPVAVETSEESLSPVAVEISEDTTTAARTSPLLVAEATGSTTSSGEDVAPGNGNEGDEDEDDLRDPALI